MVTGTIGYSGQQITTKPAIVNPDTKFVTKPGQQKMTLTQNTTSPQTTPIYPPPLSCRSTEKTKNDPYTIYLTQYAVTDQTFLEYEIKFWNEHELLKHGPNDPRAFRLLPNDYEELDKIKDRWEAGKLATKAIFCDLATPFYDQAKAWYKEHGPKCDGGCRVKVSPTESLIKKFNNWTNGIAHYNPETQELITGGTMPLEHVAIIKKHVLPSEQHKIDELYEKANWPPYFQEKVLNWLADYYLFIFINERMSGDRKPENIEEMKKRYTRIRDDLLYNVFPKEDWESIISKIESPTGDLFHKKLSRFGHLMKREQTNSFPYICERLDKIKSKEEAVEVVKEAHEIFRKIASENVMGLMNVPEYYINIIRKHFNRFIEINPI